MPTVITDTKAPEEGTYIVTAKFRDEDGNLVAPKTMNWSLIDEDGSVVNSQEDNSISSPQDTENIVLKGEDLALTDGRSEEARYVVFEGTYDSTLGNDLPLNDQIKFYIVNLKKVT
jgi:hypothetical protein